MKNTLLIGLYTILCWLLLIMLFAAVANVFWPAEAKTPKYALGVPFEWRVVDGDTISTISRPRAYYRFLDYDSPEITKPKCEAELLQGERAKEYLKTLLSAPNVIWLDTGQIDRYGRSLVRIWIKGKTLSSLMITSNYGVANDGKSKFNWCAYLKRKAS